MLLCKKIFIFSFLLLTTFFLFSQELPRGYNGINLGFTVDQTKETLIATPQFGYHGDRDVSLLSGENRVLIETDSKAGYGSDFLERCYFQFTNDYLYIITININREKMDYFSMFKTLCEKYGNPKSLNPQTAMWENDTTTLYLEKPLTLKYIDNDKFAETDLSSQIGPAPTEITQKMFLDTL